MIVGREDTNLQGSCLCGAVVYKVARLDPQMAHCHCNMCRKFHGAAFATYGSVKSADFSWQQGEQFLQEFVADNQTTRTFCKKCGSSLTFAPSADSGEEVEIALATLDTEIDGRPSAHIFTEFKANWHQITDDCTKFLRGRDSQINSD